MSALDGRGATHVHGPRGTRASGFTPGFGLTANSPLRVACPMCSAGIARKCVKVDRYGLESPAARVHPERTAAAREVYVPPPDQPSSLRRRQKQEPRQ